MKVIAFYERFPTMLAELINEWMEAHPEYVIGDIRYAASERYWSALILYEEK
jgi:hypothetical protein